MPADSPIVYKLVDPTDPGNEKWLRLLCGIILTPNSSKVVDAFSEYRVKDEDIEYCLRFTYPLYPFAKTPAPTEDAQSSTDQKAPQKTHLFVMNPMPLGKGSFGEVSSVIGSWSVAGDQFSYKIKTLDKKRVVKSYHRGSKSAKKEFDLLRAVPHLSARYQPAQTGNNQLLLMRQQPGVSLKTLIEQAKISPEILTVRQRLEISIAILEALDSQAKNYGLNHCDIKPDNLIVNLGPPVTVKLIDYGLALPTQSTISRHVAGTRRYMAPEILESRIFEEYRDKKIKADTSTDLFSAALSLAELWGDESRYVIDNCYDKEWELYLQNKDYPLTRLFAHIQDLEQSEQNDIKLILHKLTRYERAERMGQADALTRFRAILRQRLSYEEGKLSHYGRKKSFYKLKRKQLFRLINGQQDLSSLFTRHKTKRLQHLIDILGSDIAKLQPQTIQALTEQGLRLDGDNTLIYRYLKRSHPKASNLLKLIELGAPVPPTVLSDWLTKMVYDKHKIEWIEISRLLYAHCADRSQIESAFRSVTFSFNYNFYRFFLKEGRKYLPLTCLRILEQRQKVEKILTTLRYLRQTEPRGSAMHIFDRLKEELDQDLESCFKPEIDVLLDKFKAFLEIRREAEAYHKTATNWEIFLDEPLAPSIKTQKDLCFKEVAIPINEVTAADSGKGITKLLQFLDQKYDHCKQLLYYLRLLNEAYERFRVREKSSYSERLDQIFADSYEHLSQNKPLPEAIIYLLGCIDCFNFIKDNIKGAESMELLRQAYMLYNSLSIDNSKDSYIELKAIATALGDLRLKSNKRVHHKNVLYADPVYIRENNSSPSLSNGI